MFSIPVHKQGISGIQSITEVFREREIDWAKQRSTGPRVQSFTVASQPTPSRVHHGGALLMVAGFGQRGWGA